MRGSCVLSVVRPKNLECSEKICAICGRKIKILVIFAKFMGENKKIRVI